MRIEDLKFILPTESIDEKSFNFEKWRKETPIDYLKAVHIILSASNLFEGIPGNLATDSAFHTIYRIIREYIPETLYKYYSLTDNNHLNKIKLNTLQNRQIFMSDIRAFNDPFDGKAFYYDPEKLKDIARLAPHNGRLIDDFTVFHKATSLTGNDVNCMPMWAHYSNNHHGFCVAYDMNDPQNLSLSSCTFPVQYTDQRLDITSFMIKQANMISNEIGNQSAQRNNQILINDLSLVYVAQFLCNIKHISWQYEKEFRCSMGATANGMPYVDAIPKAIYIGMKCLPKHEIRLRQIAKTLNIPIYKMVFEECSTMFNLGAIAEQRCGNGHYTVLKTKNCIRETIQKLM